MDHNVLYLYIEIRNSTHQITKIVKNAESRKGKEHFMRILNILLLLTIVFIFFSCALPEEEEVDAYENIRISSGLLQQIYLSYWNMNQAANLLQEFLIQSLNIIYGKSPRFSPPLLMAIQYRPMIL